MLSPVAGSLGLASSPAIQLRLLTWNSLADCYAPRHAPPWDVRSGQIRQSIAKHPADLLMLQEVDNYNSFWEPVLTELGFDTRFLARPTRKDGLLIAFNRDRLLLTSSEEVLMDDLAVNVHERTGKVRKDSTFERNNVGLICTFQSQEDKSIEFLASTCHLFWNPQRPEVKMAQARYMLQRVEQTSRLRAGHARLPVILGGDFNVLPNSSVYALITQSPHQPRPPAGSNSSNSSSSSGGGGDVEDDDDPLLSSALSDGSTTTDSPLGPGGETRFLVDLSLSKLARWMRVLGIDCVLESVESQRMRTGQGGKKGSADFSLLFDQARAEGRVLLTSSRSMRERSACPPSMLISTSHLEQELSRICSEHEINISEDRFLTVCGKCGGGIETVSDPPTDPRLAGRFFPTDRPVFCCSACSQLYWWNERENSSPARAMRVAERLHKLITGDENWRGGGKEQGKEQQGQGQGQEQEEEIDSPSVSSSSDLNSRFERRAQVLSNPNPNPNPNPASEPDLNSNPGAARAAEAAEAGEAGEAAVSGEGKSKRPLLNNRRFAEALRLTEAARSSLPAPASASASASASAAHATTTTTMAAAATASAAAAVAAAQSLGLRSAHCLAHRGREARLTNHNGNFRGTLDYLFVSAEFAVKGCEVRPKLTSAALRSRTPSSSSSSASASASASEERGDGEKDVVNLDEHGDLPNALWPSDHLLVLADVSLPH